MRLILSLGLMWLIVGAERSIAQEPAGHEGTPNMHVVAHIPMGSKVRTGDVEIEQELSRPYAYINTRKDVSGFDIISLKDPARAYIMYQWRITNPELHLGGGGMDIEYFKSHGHYYVVNAMQFFQGGPDPTLPAVIVDVTGLPDTSKVKEVRRIIVPDAPGGFHDVFPYKHSDGRALLFATSGGGGRIYDLDKVIAGDPNQGYVGFVPVPAPGAAKSMTSSGAAALRTSYHDFYVGYDPANHRDVFYG